MTNYLKEMKNKCGCPLCKKPLNKRELTEAPKLKIIADIFQKIVSDSSRIDSSTNASQLDSLKKRKFNDYLKLSQGIII